MKTIGIKLADGSFYPILEEGEAKSRALDVTTVKDNQTKVQIDLYRSETDSMTDAEYVDTLEVTNLKPHPNGEPDLHLSVSLDENNELKAEVIDAETGEKSEVQVQLVSRTLAERESSDVDFSLPKAGALAAGLAAAGTAAAVAATQSDEEDKTDEFITDDFSFDDFTDEQFATKEEQKAAEATEQAEKEIDASANDANVAATTSLDDITLDLPPLDDFDSFGTESSAAEKTLAEDAAVRESTEDDMFAGDDMFDMPAEGSPESADDFTMETSSDTDTAITDKSLDDISLDLPDFDDNTATATASASASEAPLSDDDFSMDLPDYDDTEFDLDTKDTADTTASDTALNEEDFSLPDFDESPADTSSDTDTASDADTTGISGLFDDPIFDNDDFTAKDTATAATATTAATSSAMDFSDLYDDETLAGEHSTPYDNDEAEEVKRKTRVPVIICVICAIICIIATLLVLFVIPSKYNLIKSRNTKHTDSEWVEPKTEVPLDVKPVEAVPVQPAQIEKEPEPIPVEAPEPEVPSVVETTDAQEDKIVVAPKPDIVPVPAEKPKVKKDVRYRIKWGDTLWDISDSYYKNPWKYPKIARYNGIKNPDLIISGTDILIPEE